MDLASNGINFMVAKLNELILNTPIDAQITLQQLLGYRIASTSTAPFFMIYHT